MPGFFKKRYLNVFSDALSKFPVSVVYSLLPQPGSHVTKVVSLEQVLRQNILLSQEVIFEPSFTVWNWAGKIPIDFNESSSCVNAAGSGPFLPYFGIIPTLVSFRCAGILH